jgi:hypothetical protein
MTLRPGEVVLIRIDFHQTPGGKLRPAVVFGTSGQPRFPMNPQLTAGIEICQAQNLNYLLVPSCPVFQGASRHASGSPY